MTIEVSNASRVVYPATGHTKGDVVRHYQRAAPRLLEHIAGRPLTLRRFPRGVGAPGFFQKNVPPHYPESMARVEIPRREGATTIYPCVSEPDHLAFLANQGVIELHTPMVTAANLLHPDRFVIDLDPPEGAVDLVRAAARKAREALEQFGLQTIPVATGSKGYHVVGALQPTVDAERVARCAQQLATLLAHGSPDTFTDVFRVAGRNGRVFVDWLRNQAIATVVAPFSLRARSRPTIACPLQWDELNDIAPDGIDIDTAAARMENPDPLAALARHPTNTLEFVAAVEEAFTRSGLELVTFDRFRS
jgi:bifunctional non-homologous end joining protein LigD